VLPKLNMVVVFTGDFSTVRDVLNKYILNNRLWK
jgi:hypothetical protein